MKRKLLRSEQGFTLVELMIVVVIMGILVAVAIPIYAGLTNRAERQTCHSNCEIIEKARRTQRRNSRPRSSLVLRAEPFPSAPRKIAITQFFTTTIPAGERLPLPARNTAERAMRKTFCRF